MTDFAERLVRPIVGAPWRVPLAAAAVVALAVGVQWLRYRGEALPAVRVLGVDVGGGPRGQIEHDVFVAARHALARPVVIHARQGLVTVRPADVLRVDIQQTAAAALAAGRSNVAVESLRLLDPVSSHPVEPVFRERPKPLAALFARIQAFGRAPRPATVSMRGLAPVVQPGRTGVVVDRAALIAAVERSVEAHAGPVAARFAIAPPPIGDAAARRAALEARVAVSGPVRLTYGGASV